MPRHLLNEGVLQIPDDWQDKTVTALSFPAGASKADASFAVTRDPAAANLPSLAAYVDKQLVEMAKGCPKFELIERHEASLGGAPAQSVSYTWRSPDGTIVQQLQAISLLGSGTALVLTATAPRDKFAQFATTFENMMSSFQFHS
jgi:hypothetical protein